MFSNERTELRKFYHDCWLKYQKQQPVSPLEQQIIEVLLAHPEYHSLFEHFDKNQNKDFLPEMGDSNPFLHLSLHLSIREQIGTDRPAGIKAIYLQLCQQLGEHETEHQLMDCLAEALWQAQRNNTMPDEQRYLEQIKQLLIK